ncbi:MAG TPA: protein kinase [Kofleriaceae bacterium]|nr:protein kinase [Kofleriaceae bacterium]
MSQSDTPVDPLTPTAAAKAGDTISTQPVERITLRDVPDYDLGEVIGRGGMGEVVVAHHRQIGRDVALKRMRAERPTAELVERFLREARIQARLDHPSIAPVHELGFDSEGLPYFTMKRVSGTTLAEVLERTSERPQRLLRALVDVCQAVELAHARNIVHRDLKPSNIMLGDYGEVYVLDWGVARVLTSADNEPVGDTIEDVISLDGVTQDGALLGTPGYMAPEQARGEPVGPKADIYALGSMLFEILSGEPLHPRGREALATTLSNIDGSPAKRRPERGIAPELDALCIAALSADPGARPGARALADAIQGYLDGDRDVERRRALASELSNRARTALSGGDRERAMRSAGRALALDPGSTAAADVVMSLIVEEPPELPAEVERSLDVEETKMMRIRSRRAVLPYAAIFLVAPMLPFLHIARWPMLMAVFAMFGLMVTITWINSRVGVPIWITLVGHTATSLLFSQLIGPFIITPVMLCAILLSATSIPWLNRRWWAVIIWTTVTVMLPFMLEHAGVLPTTWSMTPAGLVSHGSVFIAERMNASLIILGHVFAIVLVAGYARRIGRDRSDAQRRLLLQAWQLSHLLPKTVKA